MNSSVYSSGTPSDFYSINNGIYFSGHDGDITIGSGNGYKTYFAWGTTGQSAHVINASGALGFSTNLSSTPATSGTSGFGTTGQVLSSNGNASAPTWVNASSLATAAGGSNTQVQYNSSGALAGSANFVFDGTNVGIGTSAPSYRLNIQSAGGTSFNRDFVVRVGDQTNFYRQSFVYNASGSTVGAFPSQSGGLYWEQGGGFGISGGLVISTNNANAGPVIFGTADTERMRIDSSGNVGIGTSSPSNTLEVQSTNATGQLRLTKSSGGADNYVRLNLQNSTTAYFQLASNPSVTDAASILNIYTNGAGGNIMSFLGNGNVGIGTSSPVTKLDVVGGTTTIRGAALFNTSSTAGTNSAAYIRSANGFSSATTPDYSWWYNDQCGFFHPASDVIGFTTVGVERMRINSSGYVGIGTSSPNHPLDVVSAAGDAIGLTVRNRTGNDYANFSFTTNDGATVQTGIVNALTGTNGANLIFNKKPDGSGATEAMRIDSSGNLLVGSTSYSLSVNNTQIGAAGIANNTLNGFNIALNKPSGDPQTAYQTFFWAGGLVGYIAYNGSGVNYVTTSDERLKTNIIDSGTALGVVNDIKVRSFDWVSESEHDDFGFVAQELYEAYPKAVTKQKDKEDGSMDMPWGVDYSKLVPVLVKAIQELKAEVDSLKQQIAGK
jgi:hypothetical protein